MDNLFFTDEHIMIRDMVREFADTEITPVARELDEQGEFPIALVNKMGELGLMGMLIPKEYGGSGSYYSGYKSGWPERLAYF